MAFKMKGHTVPGIKQKSEGNTDLKDGRSGSAAFQQKSPGEFKKSSPGYVTAFKHDLNSGGGTGLFSATGDPEENRKKDEAHDDKYGGKGHSGSNLKGSHKLSEKSSPGKGWKSITGGKFKKSSKSAFSHFVDDVPSHNDPSHSDDLQTDEEHKAANDRLYWPDGTKRTKREIFEYDETKAEEKKEKKKPALQHGAEDTWNHPGHPHDTKKPKK